MLSEPTLRPKQADSQDPEPESPAHPMGPEEPESGLYPVPGSRPPPRPRPLDIDTVYRSYAPYVAAIAVRLLGRGDEVEDLVQDVFLEAHRGLHRVQEPAAIKGWLAKIAVRMSMRRLKKRRAMRFLWLDEEPEYETLAATGASPEQRVALAGVYRTLDTLASDQRIAWTLRHIEGEKLERVAELMDCSLSTAKRRIDSARETLRRGGTR